MVQHPLDRRHGTAAAGDLTDVHAAVVRTAARTAGAARLHQLAAELAGSDPRPGPTAQGLLSWWRFMTGDVQGAQAAARAALEYGCDQPRARAVAAAADAVLRPRGGTQRDLDRFLAELPVPDGDLLRMRALELRGDHPAAAAAARRVVVVEAVPEALVELAVDEALHGDAVVAVSATERARVASPATSDAVAQVVERVAAAGDARRLAAFLTAGLAGVSHRGYRHALQERTPVPWYARTGVNDIATSVIALGAAATGVLLGEPVVGALVMGALLLLGFVLAWLPRQGLPRTEAKALDRALHGYRRRDKAGLIHDDRVPVSEPVPADRCVCDAAAGVLPSPTWDRYVQEHLVTVDVLPGTGAELRACPTGGDLWLHLPGRGVTLTVITTAARARVLQGRPAAVVEPRDPGVPAVQRVNGPEEPDPDQVVRWALVAAYLRCWDDAAALLKASGVDDAGTRTDLAYVLFRAGRFDEARAALDPADVKVSRQAALVARALDSVRAGSAGPLRALTRNPADPFEDHLLSVTAVLVGDRRTAEQAAAGVPAQSRYRAEALLVRAEGAAHAGQPERAVRLIEEAQGSLRGPEADALALVAGRLLDDGVPMALAEVLRSGIRVGAPARYAAAARRYLPGPRWAESRWSQLGLLLPQVLLMLVMGKATTWTFVPFVLVLTLVATVLVMANARMAGLDRRTSRRLRKTLLDFDNAQRHARHPVQDAGANAEPVDHRRCRCWQTDVLLGPSWDGYARRHLQVRSRLAPAAVSLLQCPETGVRWVELVGRGVRFRADPGT